MFGHRAVTKNELKYKFAGVLKNTFEQIGVCDVVDCKICKRNYDMMVSTYKGLGFSKEEIENSNSLIPRKLTQKFRDE